MRVMMSGYSGMRQIHMLKPHLNLNEQRGFLITGGINESVTSYNIRYSAGAYRVSAHKQLWTSCFISEIAGGRYFSPQSQAMIVTFYIALHVGTLFAVVIFFWKKIIEMIRRPFSKLPVQIVVATIPAIIINFLFGDFIESTYLSAALLGPGFCLPVQHL